MDDRRAARWRTGWVQFSKLKASYPYGHVEIEFLDDAGYSWSLTSDLSLIPVQTVSDGRPAGSAQRVTCGGAMLPEPLHLISLGEADELVLQVGGL